MRTAGGVPGLRFPKFSGEWVEKRLGETARFLKGKSISKANIVTDDGIPCIRYGELYTIYGEVISKVESQTNLPIRELIFSEVDDVIIPASGETALDIATASCVEKGNIALGGDLNIIRSPLVGHFLAYYLSHRKKKDIARLAQGNSVVHLYKDQLASLKIGTPTLPEQQKIADFLGAVDARVGLLRRRRDALRAYKKGMMQRLFSQELRFTKPDGSPFPDWQENRLGEVAKIVGGGTPDTTEPSYWDGDIPWFTPTEIKTKYLTDSARTLSVEGLKQSSAKLLPVGTLLLSTRANVGDIGIARKECTTNQGFQAMIVNPNQFNEFWYYWIVFHKRKFIRWAAGSTFLEINKTEVSKIPANVPHLEEQQKIADTLSALDAKIDAVAAQMDAMLRFKKGLLQQMFV